MLVGRDVWKGKIPPAELHGRLNCAGCAWNLELCGPQLEDLRRTDPGAFRKFYALMETAVEEGLSASENGADGYRVPVGGKVNRHEFKGRDMPWLGELRVDERTPKRPSPPGKAFEHRLYFGEPDVPANLIVGSVLGCKRGGDRGADQKQTEQMKKAMWGIIHWCEEANPPTSWRVWNWDC